MGRRVNGFMKERVLRWAKEVLIREQVNRIRRRINDLILYGMVDDIGELPGFTIVQRRETFKSPADCFMYVFGIDDIYSGSKAIAEKFLLQLEQVPVSEIKPGDYVAYFDKENITHVGTAVSSDRVVSKFGFSSHVFEHPISFVPAWYGNKIYAFRRQEVISGKVESRSL